ncbi:unnamed protein product [Ilex paraguariensis]|uniref:Uncharacterized protein n=1 Tax=Ilex paraguariensis TaxID=185542 RepID=A0ABC8UBR3_9AQUA
MNCQSLNGVLNVAEEVNEELEVDANNRRGVMSVLEGVGLSKSQEPLCFPKRQIPARNSDTLLECEGSSLGVELGCMENQISDSSKAELVVNTKENENLSEGEGVCWEMLLLSLINYRRMRRIVWRLKRN